MNDTSLALQNKLFEMMQQKTETERFFMGASLSEMARSITQAAIIEACPDISPAELKVAFFHRWYWEDFKPNIREKICETMRLHDSSANSF